MSDKIQSISSGAGILKNFYQGPIRDQLPKDLPIYRACEKTTKGWSGTKVVRPLRVQRNQGIGAISDGGTLPSIGRQNVIQAEIQSKFNYLRFGLTAGMIAASQSDVGSFVRDASYELQEGYGDLKNDLSRQLSYDGSGYMARVNTAAVASASLVLKGREDTEEALKFVDVGLVLDIISGGSVIASGVEVLSISSGDAASSTATVTLSQAVTASAGDYIVRTGSYNKEIQGLLTALDGGTSTIYGVDRATYFSYQSNSKDNGGAQLTLDVMQRQYNEALRRGNGKIDAIWTDFASIRMYQKLLTPDKRYVNSVKADGSFGSEGKFYLDFNGVALVPDKDCPPRMFFVNQDALTFYILKNMEFADETGTMYIAQTSQDALEVRVRHFGNMFNEAPASCAVLKNYISP
jgi:hypothetical protein